MIYTFTTDTGSLVVAPETLVAYKGLDIVGRDQPDWNKPIQQSLITIIDLVDDKLDAADLGTNADFIAAVNAAMA